MTSWNDGGLGGAGGEVLELLTFRVRSFNDRNFLFGLSLFYGLYN